MNLPKETAELLEGYFVGDPSAETIAAMEAWLNEDPTHPRILAEYGLIDRLIRHEQKKQDASAIFSALLESEEEADFALPAIQYTTSNARSQSQYVSALSYVLRHTFTPKRIAMLATAAAVLLSVVVALVLLTDSETPEPIANQTNQDGQPETDAIPYNPIAPQIVATLTGERDAVWGRRPGEDLFVGQRLTLEQGFAEITTLRGAVAILEAPATIELIDSENAVYLHNGKLVGLCYTKRSQGFVVKTEFGDITDLGTEFGIKVRPEGIESTVFSGEIEFKVRDGNPVSLQSNQTMRLDAGGSEVVVEDQLATGFDKLLRPAVVTKASTNLDRYKIRVVPRGVYEDARLFTDRLHEMNGIDEAGIPEALLLGDLVMMASSARTELDRNAGAMELQIELAGPADIYVLYPKGLEYQAWLTRDYVKTGMTVGLDRGEGGHRETAGIGPGMSIDRTLEVWKYKSVTEDGRFTVAGSMHQAMYAVVVVPQDFKGIH